MNELKRSIGPFGLLFAAVGGIIGSGWLFGPLYASQMAGPAAIFSWIIGGLLMMVIALTFAELSTMFPVAGGFARFTHFSHGPLVSFTMSWCGWISSLVVAPIETMALLQYASNYFPFLTEKIGGVTELTALGIGVAALLMLIMCCINLVGIHLLAKTNTFIVLLKLAVPIFTLLVLFSTRFEVANFTDEGFMPMGIKGVLSALPAAGVIFSFIGYNPAIQLAGEAKNPQKILPRAILGSLAVCIVLYVLIQSAFIGAIPEGGIASGWDKVSFAGENGPFVGIAASLGLGFLVIILYLDAILSPFGTALIYTSASSRLNFAMSQNGYLPEIMQKLNKKGVPYVALIVNYLLGLILFVPFPGWQSMVTFLVSAFIFSYAVGPIALISLREKLPEEKRPFKLPMAYLIAFCAFFICNLLAFWTGWTTIWRILLAIFIGYVFLFFYSKTHHGKQMEFTWKSSWWLFPHFIGMGCISLLGTFKGGLGIIPFGLDFLVIAIFSFIIFYFAKHSSQHHETLVP